MPSFLVPGGLSSIATLNRYNSSGALVFSPVCPEFAKISKTFTIIASWLLETLLETGDGLVGESRRIENFLGALENAEKALWVSAEFLASLIGPFL